MKTFKAVIFDCDGVMFDSRQANINFYNSLLANFDLQPMTDDQVDYIHMHTATESMSHIFQGSAYEKMAREYRIGNDYAPFIKDMMMAPGLKELLQSLKGRFGLGVATNRSVTIGDVLKINDLDAFFDIVVSSLDVKNSKPHPESLFKIFDFFEILPEQTLYIGDSIVDYEMARDAKVPFVAYQNRKLAADYHVEHHHQIGHIVGVNIP